MTTKKKYEKPALQVFELKQTGMLMVSNNSSATMKVTYEEETWNE